MEEISTVGIDLAKSVFQVHAVDAAGNVIVRRQLRRQQMLKFFEQLAPCVIGMEACGTAHYWARELSALGHEVRLMPPAYVKPYVKRQKNDVADAEAICEAVMRPTMRFVPIKSVEQQSATMLHRSRALLVKQRTMLMHSIRSHLAELGISTGAGISQADYAHAFAAQSPDDPPVTTNSAGSGYSRRLVYRKPSVDHEP